MNTVAHVHKSRPHPLEPHPTRASRGSEQELSVEQAVALLAKNGASGGGADVLLPEVLQLSRKSSTLHVHPPSDHFVEGVLETPDDAQASGLKSLEEEWCSSGAERRYVADRSVGLESAERAEDGHGNSE